MLQRMVLSGIVVVGLVLGGAIASGQTLDRGLVGWYTFEEGRGQVVTDKSGKGNHGKILGNAQWKTGGTDGAALELDGKSAYIDCGSKSSLNIASAGTVMIRFSPREMQGGLVNWSTGPGWKDQRLVLAFNSYQKSTGTLTGCFADGTVSWQFTDFGPLNLKRNDWLDLALTFDGKKIHVYRDGLLISTQSQPIVPAPAGVPLWIGRCTGLGKDYFHGLVGEVRIFNRALSDREILDVYKSGAAGRGKETAGYNENRLAVRLYPVLGKIVATLDARYLHSLSDHTKCILTLRAPGSMDVIASREIVIPSQPQNVDVAFDAVHLETGPYLIALALSGLSGTGVEEKSRVEINWPGRPAQFSKTKILNNLVWELLKIDHSLTRPAAESFSLPYDRWIFVQTRAKVKPGGEVRIGIDSGVPDEAVIAHTATGESTFEIMRFLKAGTHEVHIGIKGDSELESIVVRAIPMLQYAFYGANPLIVPFGPYDWNFLRKDILPNVNTMLSSGPIQPPELKGWKESGRSWVAHTGVPGSATGPHGQIDLVLKAWSEAVGMQNPLMDGIIIDEFSGGDDPVYDVYRQAVERIYENTKLHDKLVMLYGGTLYGQDRSAEFARVCIAHGGYICRERYLPEPHTEMEARDLIRSRLAGEMQLWENRFSEAARHMCIVLGYMSTPPESLNVDPTVDYKVFMDMQLHALATQPEFFGLGGIQEYESPYSDEETVRWAGKLYRHYCIEGNTERLTHDPYKLTHLANPDFDEATSGWTISAAEPGSVAVKQHAGYSWLQGRYPLTRRGDSFLWMKRSGKRPNTFSQRIKDLTPGRLYSLKIITSDYQDLIQQQSRKADASISIKIEGVQMLTGPKESFQFTYPNSYAHRLGKFTDKYNYWLNYHWRVFRANGTSAGLIVSDWKSDTDPGGPFGQELAFNFIEIQPYIGE